MNLPSLPKGWRREEQMREGIGKGKLVQTIYWSPQVNFSFKNLLESYKSFKGEENNLNFTSQSLHLTLKLGMHFWHSKVNFKVVI